MLNVLLYLCAGMAIYGNTFPALRKQGKEIGYGHVIGAVICVALWPIALSAAIAYMFGSSAGRAYLKSCFKAGRELAESRTEAAIQADPVALAKRTARRARRAEYWAMSQEERNALPKGRRFRMWLRQLLRLPK